MKQKRTIIAGLSLVAATAVIAYCGVENAYAYTTYTGMSTLGHIVQLAGSAGSMGLEDGNELQVTKSGPYSALYGANLYAALCDTKVYLPSGTQGSQGDWPIIQSDVSGANANNGYLLVASQATGSTNISDWITRLGGNVSYVERSLSQASQQIQVKNTSIYPNSTITYDAYADLVSKSGAKFGPTTDVVTSQKDAQGNYIVNRTYTIYESAPPTAKSISVSDGSTGQAGTVTQGDPINFTASWNVPLWSGLASYHYDAIQIQGPNGYSKWITQSTTGASGNSDTSQMLAVQGGSGTGTDSTVNGAFQALNSSSMPLGAYTVSFWVGDGVDRISSPAVATFNIQQGLSSGGSGGGGTTSSVTISLSANPTSLDVGQSSTLTATVSGAAANAQDEIEILDQSSADTLGGKNTATIFSNSTATATATSSSAMTDNYIAELVDFNTGQVIAQSQPAAVTWISPPRPSISASPTTPTTVDSQQPVQISYQTQNWAAGDYVMVSVSSSSGKLYDEWKVTQDISPSDTFTEVESPFNGQSVSVSYRVDLYNSNGALMAFAYTSTITWKSVPPTISMSANPTTLVPGQPSTISYVVNGVMGGGDYVTISGTGGYDMWHTTNQTNDQETYREIENPGPGQVIVVNYTGTIFDSSGTVISTTTLTVRWDNAWNGSISMAASPQYLEVGKATALTASTTQAVPSGYSVVIEDTSTGQIVSSSGTAPLSAQYTSYKAETDQFKAYVYDGYVHVGPDSNTVNVTWSALTLGVNPDHLPVGQGTTLTTSAQSVPSGDYLIIQNLSTGQVVGYGQGSTYSVVQTEWTPQNDVYQAFINSSPTASGAYAVSNQVTVAWFTVQLTAVPTKLPIGKGSLITASASNIPAGYVLDIVDQTTGSVIASGQPGQSTLSTVEVKNSAQTDNYVAQVVQPSNPGIPSLNVPVTIPAHGAFAFTSDAVYVFDTIKNQWDWVASVPNPDGTTNNPNGTPDGQTAQQWAPSMRGNLSPVYSPLNNTVYVFYWDAGTWGNDQPGSIQYYLMGFNLSTGKWTQSSIVGSDFFGNVSDIPLAMTLNPNTGHIFIIYLENATGNGDQVVYDYNPLTDTRTQVNIGYIHTHYNTSTHRQVMDTDEIPDDLVAYDPRNNMLFSEGLNAMAYMALPEQFLYSNLGSNTSGALDAVDAYVANGTEGSGIVYDPYTGLMYFFLGQSGWSSSSPVIVAYNSATGTATQYQTGLPAGVQAYSMVMDLADGTIYISSLQNGNETVTYQFNPSTGMVTTIGSYPSPNQSISNLTYDGDTGTVLGSSGGVVYQYRGGWWQMGNTMPETAEVGYVASSAGASQLVNFYPFWTFNQLPSYVPQSLFPDQAQSSGQYASAIWTTASANPPNGTAFFQSMFTLPQSGTVNFTSIGEDDYAQIYVDGKPIMQVGNAAGSVGGSIPYTSNTSVQLAAGPHQVIIEAMNDNGFSNPGPNAAAATLMVTAANGQTLLTTANPWQWTTTGYVTQLPSGWFSGAVGTYPFTEYVMGESGTPVTQQASYTVQTVAQNVALQSSPVSVTWFQPIIAPDNFTLQAMPTSVTYPQSTQFEVTFDQSDVNFVNQQMSGQASVVVRSVQTWQVVASGTWKTSSGTSLSMSYTPPGGTSLQYVAFLVDDEQHVELAVSNEVSVTSTGNGLQGSQSSTTSCSAAGDGTEIINTYTNGTLTNTKQLPLTMQHLELDGIYNPTTALKSYFGSGGVPLPITNDELGYGVPIPVRVQAPIAFALQFPDAQPITVTATLTVIEGDPINRSGDTSWTVPMHSAANLGYGFWEGDTIIPKLPDGDHITINITAVDSCGTNSTGRTTSPYNNFVTTNGRPEWYFSQPTNNVN